MQPQQGWQGQEGAPASTQGGPPPSLMMMGPQNQIFGFPPMSGGPPGPPGGQPGGGQQVAMGWPNSMMNNMQNMAAFPPSTLAYMPWFPQMAQMGQLGMAYPGMGAIPAVAAGGATGPVLGGSDDAQRKRRERDETNMKWASLDALAPPASSIQGGNRSQSLRSGRTKLEVLEAVVEKVRGMTRLSMCLREAFAINKDVGMIIVDMSTSEIKHVSKGFEHMGSWLSPDGMQGLLLTSLVHPEDAPKFRQFAAECHTAMDAMRRAGGSPVADGKRSVSMRMLIRPSPAEGQRVPDWLLVYTPPITLTLTSIGSLARPRASPANVSHAVFTADLSKIMTADVEAHAAHVRSVVESGELNRVFELSWETAGVDPFHMMTACFGWGRPTPAKGGKKAAGIIQNATRRPPGLLAKQALKAVKQLSVRRAGAGDDRLEMLVDSQVDFVGGGSYRRAERIVLDAFEKAVPPPASLEVAKAGDAAAAPPPAPVESSKGKPRPGRHQKVMVVFDAERAEELGRDVHFVSFSVPGAARSELKKEAEIRCDFVLGPQALKLNADMPWYRGSTADKFAATGALVPREEWEKASMDEQWTALQAEIMAETQEEGANNGEFSRGAWKLVQPAADAAAE